MLPITFMDGNTKTLYADSATTARWGISKFPCALLEMGIEMNE